MRPRRYHVRSNLVAVIPQSGVTAVENRTLLQPPSPGVNNISTNEDNITDDTKELIDILKKHTNGQQTITPMIIRFLII